VALCQVESAPLLASRVQLRKDRYLKMGDPGESIPQENSDLVPGTGKSAGDL